LWSIFLRNLIMKNNKIKNNIAEFLTYTVIFTYKKDALTNTSQWTNTRYTLTLNLSYLSFFGKVGRRASHRSSTELTGYGYKTFIRWYLAPGERSSEDIGPKERKRKKPKIWFTVKRDPYDYYTWTKDKTCRIVIIFQRGNKYRTDNCNLAQYWLTYR